MLLGAIGTDVQGKASTLNLENILSPFMIGSPLIYIGGLGSFLVDGNYTWRENMTVALEEYAQEPTLLEDTASECIYTFTAYRLSVTYGVAALVTLLCVLGRIVRGVGRMASRSRWISPVS